MKRWWVDSLHLTSTMYSSFSGIFQKSFSLLEQCQCNFTLGVMFVARQFFLNLHAFECKIFRPKNAWLTNIKYGCLLYSFLSFINDINFDVPMTVYSHLIAYQVYQTPATLMGESRDYQKQISTISIKKSKPNWKV